MSQARIYDQSIKQNDLELEKQATQIDIPHKRKIIKYIEYKSSSKILTTQKNQFYLDDFIDDFEPETVCIQDKDNIASIPIIFTSNLSQLSNFKGQNINYNKNNYSYQTFKPYAVDSVQTEYDSLGVESNHSLTIIDPQVSEKSLPTHIKTPSHQELKKKSTSSTILPTLTISAIISTLDSVTNRLNSTYFALAEINHLNPMAIYNKYLKIATNEKEVLNIRDATIRGILKLSQKYSIFRTEEMKKKTLLFAAIDQKRYPNQQEGPFLNAQSKLQLTAPQPATKC
jgi:hypothetical protein